MPNMTIKTLFLTASICGLTTSTALAQISELTESVNVPTRIVDADFVTADINQDGSLDRDEFVSFAVMKSEAGDEKYQDVVSSGLFNKKFAVHDHNADEKITADEMGAIQEDDELMIDKPAPTTEDDLSIKESLSDK
ncbi:MAG: hypothetical protein ABJG88_00565 [Litorimonas sp.]